MNVVCEGKKETISCSSGKVIRIYDVNYGRADRETCIHKAMSNTQCSSASYVQN